LSVIGKVLRSIVEGVNLGVTKREMKAEKDSEARQKNNGETQGQLGWAIR
jgi:hypothetical protein